MSSWIREKAFVEDKLRFEDYKNKFNINLQRNEFN